MTRVQLTSTFPGMIWTFPCHPGLIIITMKLSKFYLTLLFLIPFFIPHLAAAQNTGSVSGFVYDDRTSEPVAGANLYIAELNRGTATDENGEFTLANLPPGSYSLRVSYISYETRLVTVQISGSEMQRLNIRLTPQQTNLNGIVVTSLRPDLRSGAELNNEQIRSVNPRDPAELLRGINGLDAVRRGPIGLDPVIRGLRETEVGTYLDGTRMFPAGPARMDSPLSHLDPMMIESIEVIKGPYALNWGAGNMGAIRVRTKSLTNLNERFGGQIIGGYDSNFNTIETGMYLNGRSGPIGYMLSAARRSGSDYESGNGTSIPGNYLSQEVRGKFDIAASEQSVFTLSLGYQNQDDIDYPGRLLDADYFDTYNASASWEWTPEDRILRNIVARAYVNSVLHGMNNDQKPTAQPNPNRMPPFALDVRVETENTVTGGQLSATFGNGSDWELEAGADIYSSYRDAKRTISRRDNSTQLFFDLMWPEATITDLGVYNRLNYSFSDNLSATGSLRVDFVSATTDTISQFFVDNVSTDLDSREANLSASATLNYLLSENWTVGAGVGSVVRTADASERYSDRIPASKAQTSAEFVGNPDLDPERSTQADLWLDGNYDRFSVSVNAFVRQMDNYITLTPTSLPKRLPLSPDTVFQYINGSAQFAGFDISLTGSLIDRLQAKATLSYLWGRDTELDEPALGISPVLGTLGLRYDFSRQPIFVESTLTFAGSQDSVASARGETATDGYQLMDVQGGWYVTRSISLQIGVKNLFDTQYVNHLNSKNPYTAVPIAEPGRVFFADVSIDF